MTRALIDQSPHRRRFGTALAVAIVVHLAAFSFATTRRIEPKVAAGFIEEPAILTVEPEEPHADPPPDLSDTLPTPAVIEPLFVETTSTPPPIHRQIKFAPQTRRQRNAAPGSMNLSSAKVLAVSAPRPEYPYEARRQRITGDGIAIMTIDPTSGNVINVEMFRSTGNSFLDNAAVTGFKRWRFKPGSVSSVTCPVSFTLNGSSY